MEKETLNKIIEYINKQPISNGLLNYSSGNCEITFPNKITVSLYPSTFYKDDKRLDITRFTKNNELQKIFWINLTNLEYELLKEALSNYKKKCIEKGKHSLMEELGI